ncbi:MAG: sigma-54 interaction domain-containing protein [bacterium]
MQILIIGPNGPDETVLTDRLSSIEGQIRYTGDAQGMRRLIAVRVPDLFVLDAKKLGIELHRMIVAIKQDQPVVPIVVFSDNASVDQVVSSMRAGAAEYILESDSQEKFIQRIEALLETDTENKTGLIAEDTAMKATLALAARVANSEASVLISGESGTGKEVLARYIHENSSRHKGPMVAINCAAIPENMLEAVLFGHEKGAFTGAIESRAGKFEQANGGTILLDEISEMPLSLQAKLLRVLQEKEVERIGGKKTMSLDVRVLATTNKNLREAVTAKEFREDLYFRLNVFPVHLPPLRERPDDIVPLAKQFILRHGQVGQPRSIDRSAQQVLLEHSWAGNVRELENVIQRALIVANGKQIELNDLMFDDQPSKVQEEGGSKLGQEMWGHESAMILETLRTCAGSRKKTAEKLGISPRTLRYKLSKLREAGVALP